jgi:hypothetical protein
LFVFIDIPASFLLFLTSFFPERPPILPEVIDKAQHPPHVWSYFRFPSERHTRHLCFWQYDEKGRRGGFTPSSRLAINGDMAA